MEPVKKIMLEGDQYTVNPAGKLVLNAFIVYQWNDYILKLMAKGFKIILDDCEIIWAKFRAVTSPSYYMYEHDPHLTKGAYALSTKAEKKTKWICQWSQLPWAQNLAKSRKRLKMKRKISMACKKS